MKKIQSVLLSAVLFFLSLAAFPQEEFDNEGMPITDLDGNVYRIIMTESGVWTMQNLTVFKLNDGTPLKTIYDNKTWAQTKVPAVGFFKSDVKYAQTYGAIYNWYAVATGKLCPKGWHVPTAEEWNDMMDYAGQSQKSGNNPAKLKESGTTHWKTPNKGATDDIHFTALPTGEINLFTDDSYEPGTRTHWWTSTEDRNNLEPGQKPTNAEIVGLSYNFNSKTQGTFQKEAALPVRCKLNDE